MEKAVSFTNKSLLRTYYLEGSMLIQVSMYISSWNALEILFVAIRLFSIMSNRQMVRTSLYSLMMIWFVDGKKAIGWVLGHFL